MGGKSSSKNYSTMTTRENVLNNTGDGNALSLAESRVGGSVIIEDNSDEVAMHALDFAYDISEDNANVATSLFDRSTDFAESALLGALDTSSYNMQKAIDEVSDSTRYTQQMTSQTIDRALALADAKTNSDEFNISQDLIKYGGLAVAAMAVVLILPRFKK